MDKETLKKALEDNKENAIKRVKELAEGGEDLKPKEDDQVLLEEDTDIKVKFEGVDELMSIEDAMNYVEEHRGEAEIENIEGITFELDPYMSVDDTLKVLKDYKDCEEDEKRAVDAMVHSGEYELQDAIAIVFSGDVEYNFYPGVEDSEQLGREIISEYGGFENMPLPSRLINYIDLDKLRDELPQEVFDAFYDVAVDEVDYEHRFDDEPYDIDEERGKWLRDHEDELLTDYVGDMIDDGDIDNDLLMDCFDYDAYINDLENDGNQVFFLPDGALIISFLE